MSTSARIIWLGLGILPYAGIATFDAWIHENNRKVPVLERAIHYCAALTLLGFLAGVFLARSALALAFLVPFLALVTWDELGFHRGIARNERRVHMIAYAALFMFIAVWCWVDART